MPFTTAASSAFSTGTSTPFLPMRRISMTIGSTPRARRTSPDKASSPTSPHSARSGQRSRSAAASRQTAIGRS